MVAVAITERLKVAELGKYERMAPAQSEGPPSALQHGRDLHNDTE